MLALAYRNIRPSHHHCKRKNMTTGTVTQILTEENLPIMASLIHARLYNNVYSCSLKLRIISNSPFDKNAKRLTRV